MNAETEMAGADGLGTELRPPEGCTGAVVYDDDNHPHIHHDAETCPVHERQRLAAHSASAITAGPRIEIVIDTTVADNDGDAALALLEVAHELLEGRTSGDAHLHGDVAATFVTHYG